MPRLSELLAPRLADDPHITGLACDSRAVRPGDLFAALPGRKADGRAFIAAAIANGATAVLAGEDVRPEDLPPGIALITDAEPRRRFALIAARFFGRQPPVMTAVTGTNGKTSVVTFLRQIWAQAGQPAASLGTLGLVTPERCERGGLTTPDPLSLHRCLAGLASEGVTHAALEASSHGLSQFRLDGVRFAAAAFTNLTRDHLDFHGDMNAYWQAKQRLFSEVMPPGRAAVINADSPQAETLIALCRQHRHRVLTYGRNGAEIRLDEIRPAVQGQELTLTVLGQTHRLHLPLAGGFQAANAACALGLAIATGLDAAAATQSLAHLDGVPGRLQKIAAKPNGAAVYVDYAHTPDALETVLTALRPHARRRLVVVFGCGGDRDAGKRPEMGTIAARLADAAYVTDDNPRNEPPAAIRAQILAACRGGIEIADRRQAILAAVIGLEAGDILVIAGKGHESGQIVGDRILPFDDAAEARRAVEESL